MSDETKETPPALESKPPIIGATAETSVSPPPLPRSNQSPHDRSIRHVLSMILTTYVGLFLAEAIVSILDDSVVHFGGNSFVGLVRGILFVLNVVLAVLIYGLMALTPMIPKRFFLPLIWFYPAVALIMMPFLIYYYSSVQHLTWLFSVVQTVLGLFVVARLHRGARFYWPLVPQEQLGEWGFSWRNLIGFLSINIFVLIPIVLLYLGICTSRAVTHYSEGFLALRPGGFMVQVRDYARSDGKTIRLVPMAHVANSEFYHKLSNSFPDDSLILMEGVTDEQNLLTNKISYKRMASSLGLSEQQKEFRPSRVQMVRADVDVEEFGPSTIDFLNLVMMIHAKGLNAETLGKLLDYSPPPEFEQNLFEDLLRKRNRHLLDELKERLPESDYIVVPWGAAHIPEIAREIQKSGFRLKQSREYVVIRFRSRGNHK